ncbi:MAG: glycoside hydrolase family 5 protein [Omnitrophica WOR_2 bacterium]
MLRRFVDKYGPLMASFSLMLLLIVSIFLYQVSQKSVLGQNFPIEHKAYFTDPRLKQFPPRLYVQDNRLVQPDGASVLLKGLMAPGPIILHDKGRFTPAFYHQMRLTGANVIRIPVEPTVWALNKEFLWRDLDPAVAWAGEQGLYVVIDWHMVGNIETGEIAGMPGKGSYPKELTFQFWKLAASYFRDTPNVLFEVFNEPNKITASEWRANAIDLVHLIRSQGASQPILIGGIKYSTDLSWVLTDPVPGENIAYAVHNYPSNPPEAWDAHFGDVADRYPVVMTEWGYMDENPSKTQLFLNGNQTGYGDPLMAYTQAHQVSWIACWFDDQWEPPLFTKGYAGYTRYGQFVLEQLRQAPGP